MPRIKPLSPADLAIAARLVTLRRHWGLSRDALAKESGVSSGVITRVELGRMPLRFEDARLILSAIVGGVSQFTAPINPLWLSDGIEPEQLDWPLFLPGSESIGLRPGATFSEFVSTNRKLLAGLIKEVPEAELPENWLMPYLQHLARLRSQISRLEHGEALLDCVFLFSAKRLARSSKEAARLLSEYEKAAADLADKKKDP